MKYFKVTVEVTKHEYVEIEVEADNKEAACRKAEEQAERNDWGSDAETEYDWSECEELGPAVNLTKAKWQEFDIIHNTSESKGYRTEKGLPIKLSGCWFFIAERSPANFALSCQRTGSFVTRGTSIKGLITTVMGLLDFPRFPERVEKAVELYGETPYWKRTHPEKVAV